MARVGGLDDDKADPSSVFLFRFESGDLVSRLCPDRPISFGAGRVPVIYRLNLLDPMGLFLAQSFSIREGDMIYVSNAGGAQLMKFLRLVGTAFTPAVNGAQLYNVAK